MKPAKFTYHEPLSLEDAFQLLEEHGDEAKIIAGGQSLIPVMNLRLAQPEHLIDINAIDGLSGISEGGERMTIGALTRHADVEGSVLLKERCPILPAAAHRIGHTAIRSRGTMGGSLVNADPAAEWSLIAILLNAEMTVSSAGGDRTAQACDFIQSVYTSDVAEDEILTAIRFPVLKDDEGWSIQQICRRAGDFAIVAVAATMRLDSSGAIEHLRIGIGCMDVTPLRMSDAEDTAIGQRPDEAWVASVSAAAAQLGDPEDDMHASATYRREVCEVLVSQALNEALQRARGQGDNAHG